jgi:hypothetical protein
MVHPIRVTENLFTDSANAARSFVLSLPNSTSQEAAVGKITGHITSIYLGSGDPLHLEPEQVAKWLLTLPDNLWHEQIGAVIERWADQDQPALDTWYSQMTPQVRDRVLAEQSRAFNWNSPTAGFKAGLRISDPELRQNTFREMFKGTVKEVKTIRTPQLITSSNTQMNWR